MKQILFGLSLLVGAGCGGAKVVQPEMAPVTGTISLKGKPLSDATVTFSSAGFPPNTMEVTNGKFSGRAMIGVNKVAVSAKVKGAAGSQTSGAQTANDLKRMQQQSGGSGGDASMVETIPAEWTQAGNHLETVTAGDGNVYTFNIK